MSKVRVSKLCVVFDTNVLYTQVASDLVRGNLKSLIHENSSHTDLDIEWHLPEVVIGERKYQMIKKATELLPAMQKMEKLLGHAFGLGEDTLALHVQNAIDASIKDCNFKITSVNTNDVNWEQLISRSVNREPPFEAGEKEKGFRDSIIAHSYLQLHKISPATPNICRLVLVSGDERLREYVSELTATSKNVRILTSLDELESLINTLVSSIPEELAADLAEKASKLFFEKENEKTFYYKQSIRDVIKEKYGDELDKSSIAGLAKGGKTWWISSPVFIKKEKSKIYWTSAVEPEFELFHMENDPMASSQIGGLGEALSGQPRNALAGRGLMGSLLSSKKVVDHEGRDIFEVLWSASLSQAGNLTKPKLEKITYLGNDLSD